MTSLQFRVVFVTVPNARLADRIAQALVERKLAACVNVIPGLVSHYYWEGKLQKDSELLLVIKTRAALMPRLIACVKQRHPASVPEIISLPILEGDKSYLQWLRAGTGPVRS